MGIGAEGVHFVQALEAVPQLWADGRHPRIRSIHMQPAQPQNQAPSYQSSALCCLHATLGLIVCPRGLLLASHVSMAPTQLKPVKMTIQGTVSVHSARAASTSSEQPVQIT